MENDPAENTVRTRFKNLAFITIGAVVLIAIFFEGVPWIARNMYPVAIMIGSVAIFIIVPCSLCFTIFKKSRKIGGVGLYLSSYAIGFSLWIWSFLVGSSIVGVFWMIVVWMIVGLLFGGKMGIVPIVCLASMLKGEWAITGQILVAGVVLYGISALSLYFLTKDD